MLAEEGMCDQEGAPLEGTLAQLATSADLLMQQIWICQSAWGRFAYDPRAKSRQSCWRLMATALQLDQ